MAFALVGLGALLGFGVLDAPRLVEFAGLDVILFLVGMMLLVGYLEESGVFEYVVEKVVERGGTGTGVSVLLMLMAGLFAALVDEVTSILFMMSSVIHISRKYEVSPIPFMMMVIFATNIGSAATVVGNPVGVMIALRGGLGFDDFLRWATPIAILSLCVTTLMCLKLFAGPTRELSGKLEGASMMTESRAPPLSSLRWPLALFALTLVGLVFHHSIEEAFGLETNTLLLGIPLLSGGITLLVAGERAPEIVERRVDWWSLTFFLVLFASVGTLRYVGVTGLLAGSLLRLTGGDQFSFFLLFLVTAGLLSALLDNVLAVATFIPVVLDLSAMGLNAEPLWWGMLFAGTFMGNLTVIGSTANIVAVGLLERQKLAHISMKEWLKYGAIVAPVTFFIAMVLIYVQIPLM